LIFTFVIGDDTYQGVSCNSYTAVYNPQTKEVTQTYNAIWYVGDWGKTNARMNQGFEGTVVIKIHNYVPATATKPATYDYYSAQFNLQGFQKFNHQSLTLTVDDSRISKLGTGICLALGNRDKM
jgi:hypothetical protein